MSEESSYEEARDEELGCFSSGSQAACEALVEYWEGMVGRECCNVLPSEYFVLCHTNRVNGD